MSHLEARLQTDLNAIRDMIIIQAEGVAKAVDDSISAVESGDAKLAYATVLADHAINRRMRDIDRLCHSFIAIHLPTAGPLRLLSSIIRANVELERIGDYAVIISREVVQMSHPPHGMMARELERVSHETSKMLHQSVHAFKYLNEELARATKSMADQLEYNMDAVYAELMSNSDKSRVKDLLATFVVFNQIKRVSDLSKNLCEHTIFAASGELKGEKDYHVMFVDTDGKQLAPLAEAIARNHYANSGIFSSASLKPAGEIDSSVRDFLHNRSLSDETQAPEVYESISRQLMSEQHVVVCLNVDMQACIETVPFHTSMVEWSITESEDVESLYRELAPQIKDLMKLLRGGEAA